MSDLQAIPGEIRMTIQVTRVATGETETHELIGKVIDMKDDDDGGHALDGSAQRCD